ncbi:MAG: septum formation family protein [Acidimicrobiales bacterium]
MSDVWQGPGWWLAPDGKWYPADGGPTDRATTETGGPSTDTEAASTAGSVGTQVAEEPTAAATPPVESAQVPPAPSPAPAPAPEAPSVDEAAVIANEAASVEPRGGWTAVEAPEDIVDQPSLGDEANWAAAGPGTTTAVPRPTSESHEPIERDDAWRKPGEGGVPLDAAERSAAPAVVDLAEPVDDDVIGEPEEIVPPSPWRGVFLALGFLAAIIGVSILLGLFFTRVVFDEDDEGVSTEGTTTTELSAPTSEDSATTGSTATPTTQDPTLGIEVSVFELETGDCIEGDLSGEVERAIRVDCSVPHDFEVYTEDVLDGSITEFDADAIDAAAEDICQGALDAYIPADDDRDIKFQWFRPTAESWVQDENPDRGITCLLFDADGPMTGRAA